MFGSKLDPLRSRLVVVTAGGEDGPPSTTDRVEVVECSCHTDGEKDHS